MKSSARRPNRRSPLRYGWLALALAALLCPPLSVHASDKEEEHDGFQVPIPVGHKAEGIKLPDFDENGNLRMNFEIGSAQRISTEVMEMSDLKIEMFDEEGAQEMRMELSRSQLDLETRILSSVEPVTIHRDDLELTGSHMIFNTRTRQGKFTGPVRMLIYNREEFDAPKLQKEESDE